MKTPLRILLFILTATLSACGVFSAKNRVSPFAELSAPVMPIWLTGDTTQIHTNDIFPGKKLGVLAQGQDPRRNPAISGNFPLSVFSNDSTQVLKVICLKGIDNGVLYGLSLLNITDRTRCDLILKKPVQIPVTFRYSG